MKRLGSSESLSALISMCPNSTVDVDEHNHNHNQTNNPLLYTMLEGLDEEGCVEEYCGYKKRRLSIDQVKALEKNFEVENKLEPERKVKLARELGLQPRQVAVWFQNRRARWKTKQLERDYGLLKANHEALKLKYQTLQRDNESLLNEIRELKLKMNGDGKVESKVEIINFDAKSDEIVMGMNLENEVIVGGEYALKEGSSDSDSSAIMNEDSNSRNHLHHEFLESKGHCASDVIGDEHRASYEFVEHNFFGEEPCTTLFSDDQAPTLHWYSSDQWN